MSEHTWTTDPMADMQTVNREILTRLVRMVSAAARGSNFYSEAEYDELFNMIASKLDLADDLIDQIEDMYYQQQMASASENP